jgi:hypothetical protein
LPAQSTVFDFPAVNQVAAAVDARKLISVQLFDGPAAGVPGAYWVTLYTPSVSLQGVQMPLPDAQTLYDLWRQRLDQFAE